jgi:hypothetical protein
MRHASEGMQGNALKTLAGSLKYPEATIGIEEFCGQLIPSTAGH